MSSDAEFAAEIRELASRPTVCVRVTARKDQLAELFGRYPAAIIGRLVELGGAPAGGLYARYYDWGPEDIRVEIGFVVAAPMPGLSSVTEVAAGEVGNGSLPAGPAAHTVHVGPYDGLPDSYNRLRGWMESEDHPMEGAPWEVYVDDPGDMSDMAAVRTEIYWPLS